MKSIISNEKICLVCSTPYALHKHHIYEGTGRRSQSEKYGCWCYLCGVHHNLSNAGVHFNKKLDLELKQMTQKKFMEVYPEIDFIKLGLKRIALFNSPSPCAVFICWCSNFPST